MPAWRYYIHRRRTVNPEAAKRCKAGLTFLLLWIQCYQAGIFRIKKTGGSVDARACNYLFLKLNIYELKKSQKCILPGFFKLRHVCLAASSSAMLRQVLPSCSMLSMLRNALPRCSMLSMLRNVRHAAPSCFRLLQGRIALSLCTYNTIASVAEVLQKEIFHFFKRIISTTHSSLSDKN